MSCSCTIDLQLRSLAVGSARPSASAGRMA
jgi:hypothetical protein